MDRVIHGHTAGQSCWTQDPAVVGFWPYLNSAKHNLKVYMTYISIYQ